ncbi:hypothetical protein DFH07DRAFT_807116 [Mycena maculata]|uniref:Uncharacterized protein n=1 Tax=Mycena maculata TaxID=230809 RepID=A0AAD7NNL3_9AGAR|nr:hypothetical protein DFH07DRAFT_807116 [Mycena maculata]
MTSRQSFHRGALDHDEDDAYPRLNNSIPTFKVTLNALERDFDTQLTAVMDNLFDEFASLQDLEPVATTTSLAGGLDCSLNLLGNYTSDALSTMGNGNEVKNTKSPRDSDSVDDGETVVRTTNSSCPTSGSHNANQPPKNRGSDSVYSSSRNNRGDGIITRHTNAPAPSSVVQWGVQEPTSRQTNVASEDTIIRSTNSGSFYLKPHGATKQLEISQDTSPTADTGIIIRSTRPDELPGPVVDGVGRQTARFEFGMSTASDSPHNFGAIHSIAQSSAGPEFPGAFSSPHASSHSMSTHATYISDNRVDEDIEMTCDSSPEIVPEFPKQSFPGMQSHNDSLGNAWNQTPSGVSWVPVNNSTVASLNGSSYPIHVYPTSEPAAQIPPCAAPLPHPSIFELIGESPCPIAAPSPYIIPPAVIPNHVWQAERARSNTVDPPRPRRTRISAPYFFRTPLIFKQVRRGNKAVTSPIIYRVPLPFDSSMKYNDSQDARRDRRQYALSKDIRNAYQVKTHERPPSPASSYSSEGFSTSFISTNSTRSYDRKLSSPPPFKRRCFEEPVESPRGIFGNAFKSTVAWLSRQA